MAGPELTPITRLLLLLLGLLHQLGLGRVLLDVFDDLLNFCFRLVAFAGNGQDFVGLV